MINEFGWIKTADLDPTGEIYERTEYEIRYESELGELVIYLIAFNLLSLIIVYIQYHIFKRWAGYAIFL